MNFAETNLIYEVYALLEGKKVITNDHIKAAIEVAGKNTGITPDIEKLVPHVRLGLSRMDRFKK